MTSLDSQVFASQILGANHTTTVRDGWAVVEAPGHTPETYDCRTVRSGRETAVAYVLRRLAGSGNDEADAESLDRLLSLVDRDPDSRTHGCMRWYAEETRVSDTNAAFFSVVPLAALIHMRPDLVPPEHQQRLRELFAETSAWFAAECRQPRLYYPNKIISDGAVLLAVGVSLGDDELIQSALAFLRSWCEYTSDRGWGWGEILSLGYQRVILMALRLAILLTQPRDPELAEALRSHERDVLEEAAFHDGAEFVPTIRSYNFSGRPRKRAFAYSLLGLPDNSFDELILQPGDAWTKTLALLLFPHELTGGVHALPTVPRKRKRRVFESATATTWIGDGVRLGSV